LFAATLEIQTANNLAVKHNLCLLSDAISIIPLFKNKSSENFDVVFVRDVYPRRRGYTYSVMTKVNKDINAVPMNKPVRIGGLTIPVMAL
jgi:hypothetical protein